jgi:hypothetical protein
MALILSVIPCEWADESYEERQDVASVLSPVVSAANWTGEGLPLVPTSHVIG